MSVWWSVGLSVTALTTTWLVGSKRRVGWLLAAYMQVAWLVYAVATSQWGFIASALAFGMINTRNYVMWRRQDREDGNARLGSANH